jgi:Tol biopolymer transport system component
VRSFRTMAALVMGLAVWIPAATPATAQVPGRDGGIALVQQAPDGPARTVIGWTTTPDPCHCGAAGTLVDLGDRSAEDPAYAPTGSSVAFTAETTLGGNRAIYVRQTSTVIRRVTRGPRDSSSPAWSPDMTQLAFTRIRDNGRPRVMVVDLSTRAVSVVSGDLAAATAPTWSPDGSSIAFAARRFIGGSDICGVECTWQLFSVDAGGGTPSRITDFSGGLRQPDWSPDGSRLAATVLDHGVIQGVMVVDAHSGSVHDFFSTGSSDTWYAEPTWSPEATSSGPYALAVTYGSTSGDDVVVIVRSEGGDPELVAYGSQASWRSLPA